MEKFGKFVVKFRYMFFGIFAAILTLSLILMPKVKSNFDIASYLPDDMETRQALTIIEDEFGMNSFINVMVKGVTKSEAEKLSKKLGEVENVKLVSFDQNSEEFYKDDCALIKLTVEGGDFSSSAQAAVTDVKSVMKDSGFTFYTGGSAVESGRLQNGISGEMTAIMLISVAIVIVILLASSRSWFEPVIFLFVVGIAILINLGTNFFLGEISYITKSVAAILQLALAMDYSIVLLHNFDSFTEGGDDAKTAAAKALSVSVRPIISSSLTTVAGLVALMFMSFKIGLDIGIVMSKGIIISMLTVFFVMPGLLVLLNKPLTKLKHKPLPLGGYKLSKGIVKARYVLPVILILTIAAGAVLQSFNSYSFMETQPNPDRDEIEAEFTPDSNIIAVIPLAKTEEDFNKQEELVEFVASLKKGDDVPFISAQTYKSTLAQYSPLVFVLKPEIKQQINSLFNGSEHSRIIFTFNLPRADDAAFKYVDEIRDKLDELYGEGNTYMAGGVMTNYDISKSFKSDLTVTNLITVISILLIIGITFRSVILPVILVLIIQGAIWISMSISFITGSPLFFMSYLIASAILMGATIDYAILITGHYTEARKKHDKLTSVGEALHNSMATVLTSGLILTIAGFIVGGMSSSLAISTIGILLGRGALTAIVLVLVLLPELLYLLDKPIQKLTAGSKFLN